MAMTTAFSTEQGKLVSTGLAEHMRTRARQRTFPNVHSVDKTVIDQDLCEVGGDGFEPPTPAL